MHLVAGRVDGPPSGLLSPLAAIADETGATIQAFDARFVVSQTHLERAVHLADRALDRGEAIADDRAVEILLYAAGRRQIDRAMEMGLKDRPHPVVVVVEGGDEDAAVAAVTDCFDADLRLDAAIRDEGVIADFFDITPAELETGVGLEDLVLERVALLVIDK